MIRELFSLSAEAKIENLLSFLAVAELPIGAGQEERASKIGQVLRSPFFQ